MIRIAIRVAGILALAASAATAADVVERQPTEVLELKGTVGRGLPVRMHLEKRDVVRKEKGESFVVGEEYSGYYRYENRSGKLDLRGHFNAQGIGGAEDDPEIEIAEFSGGRKTGVFIGRFDEEGNFAGRWESWEPHRELPFALRVVKRGR